MDVYIPILIPRNNPPHTIHRLEPPNTREKNRRRAAAAEEMLNFYAMEEAELRKWVEANLGRVNEDRRGFTPLAVAAWKQEHSLLVWLLDKKGADVNSIADYGRTALLFAASVEVLNALLDRGGDPIRPSRDGELPLMWHVNCGSVEVVARLLEDPRVRGAVNVQDKRGKTALHEACSSEQI